MRFRRPGHIADIVEANFDHGGGPRRGRYHQRIVHDNPVQVQSGQHPIQRGLQPQSNQITRHQLRRLDGRRLPAAIDIDDDSVPLSQSPDDFFQRHRIELQRDRFLQGLRQ